MKVRKLKLHHRLNIPLNICLFIIVTMVLITLYYLSYRQLSGLANSSLSHLEELSNTNIQQLNNQLDAETKQFQTISAMTINQFEKFQIKIAEDLLQTTNRPFEKAFNTGDKRALRVWLKRLAKVDGIEEISVLDAQGVVKFSSNEGFLNRETPKDTLAKLVPDQEKFRRWTDTGMETIVAKPIQRKCIRCHIHRDWKDRVGETAGYFYLKVSTSAFRQLKQEFEAFMTKHVKENKKVLAQILTSSKGKLLDLKKDNSARLTRLNRTSYTIFGAALAAILTFSILVMYFLVQKIVSKPISRATQSLAKYSQIVASESKQVEIVSQSLSQGASTQAASIEETASSLEEMASMTQQNAQNSDQANTLMLQTIQMVDKTNHSMRVLTNAMQDITTASEETSKIIDSIDEIAFQTNLLALNAAVEAARAGDAGAGFAVVADEVRNLALQTADAAKNTASLIEGTIQEVKDVSQLVSEADTAFSEVAKKASSVGDLVEEITAASLEQSQGIGQINHAVTEIEQVTQQNATNAGASTSASGEMSSQAKKMQRMVEALVDFVNGGGHETDHKSFEVMRQETIKPNIKRPIAPLAQTKPVDDPLPLPANAMEINSLKG